MDPIRSRINAILNDAPIIEDFASVVRQLDKAGAKLRGQGSWSMVYDDARRNGHVMKVCPVGDVSSIAWAKHCLNSHWMNECLPKIYEIIEAPGPELDACYLGEAEIVGDVVVIVMEKLQDIDDGAPLDVGGFIRRSRIDHIMQSMAEKPTSVEQVLSQKGLAYWRAQTYFKIALGMVDEKLLSALWDAILISREGGFHIDIDTKNVMIRGNVPVLTDPMTP